MAWDFATDPENQAQLGRADELARRGRAPKDPWATEWIPRKQAQAEYAEFLELEVGNL